MVTARITSLNKGWNTPRALFDELDREFHFALDAAANDLNRKCPMYYTEKDDALSKSWDVGGAVFVNPPYGRTLGKWVKKAYEESIGGGQTVVMLIPSRTDTRWFHEYVLPYAEIRFIRGRVRYTDDYGNPAGDSAPFPSMVVIFKS